MSTSYVRYPATGGGSGTVSSVGVSAPASILSVSGSPVTTSGIITLGLQTQVANRVWAGPATGADANPTFRALVLADLPAGVGTGTVTSVAMTVPSFLSIAGSPITTTGTLAVTLATQNPNIIFAGPSAGGAVAPAFRAMVKADLPAFLSSNSYTVSQAVVTDGSGNFASLAYSATGGTSNIVSRDANGNVSANVLQPKATAVTSAGATTTLTVASSQYQILQGSQNQTFALPDATTLSQTGWFYIFINDSSGAITITNTSGGNLCSVLAGGRAQVIATSISTANGTWSVRYEMPSNAAYGTAGLAITGTLSSSGTATLNALSVTNDTQTATLHVTGATTLATSLTGALSAASGVVSAGTLSVANGGTGAATLTNHGVLVGQATSAVAAASAGTSGQVLMSNGASADPSMQTVSGNATILKAPTIQKFTSGSGTYTTPTSPSPLYIRVRLVGGGGGGAGSGSAAAGNGGNGGSTTFGTTLLSGSPGSGGQGGATSGAAGGSASLGSGPVGLAFIGAAGGGPGFPGGATGDFQGGNGGSSPFGGGGSMGGAAAAGGAAQANTGSGGGGGGGNNVASSGAGPGGGAGGYVDAIITSLLSTYAYAVGAAGSAGSAGTNGNAGGAGAAGIIEVREYYQ